MEAAVNYLHHDNVMYCERTAASLALRSFMYHGDADGTGEDGNQLCKAKRHLNTKVKCMFTIFLLF